MATSISDGTTVVEPMLVLSWQQDHASRTVLHEVLTSPFPDVTLRPAASRSGTLELLCTDEREAVDVEQIHASGSILTITEDALAHSSFTYVVNGSVTRRLDAGTRRRWVVSIPYREVSP